MVVVTEHGRIAADPDRVFAAITDIERFPETNPDVVGVDILTDGPVPSVGTRFRETRRMGRQELVTELEVVEYDAEQRHVRMVADTDGTVWDTRMSVATDEGGCVLTIAMEARGSTWVRRMMNAVMKPMFRRGIRSHLKTMAARLAASPNGD